jgi:DNA-binding SARP family transcriptional activator
MSTLKIALLGAPEVSHFDRRLAFPDRKALALLAYLATEGGMHERQRLARLFWPDSDVAHGRTALRITLLHLRRILEHDHPLEHNSHLLVTRDVIGLNLVSGIDLDLNRLQEAWNAVHVLPAPEAVQCEMRHALIARLQEAAVVYRNGFLEDFILRDTLDFDNWIGIQRGSWYQRIEQVFDWLSRLYSVGGDLEHAIATLDRWRCFDPLNEDICLRLMQLQFAAGKRVAALKTYETYQDVLLAELSAKPPQRLVNLAEALRSASLPRSAHNGIGRNVSLSRPMLDIPFVGRAVEFSRLIMLYEHACNGQPQVVLLEGEAGIGKSRLAEEFLNLVKAQGANVLEGLSLKTSQHLPYLLLRDSMLACLKAEPDLRQLMNDSWLSELSRLLPELSYRYPDLPPPTIKGPFASSRLIEALVCLSQALASQAPLIIFADNVQWTDAATLDAFHYFVQYWTEHEMPVMLLLGMRTEAREMESEMFEWLSNLRRSISLTRLELGPLSAMDVQHISRSLIQGNATQSSLQGAYATIQPSLQHLQACASRCNSEHFGDWLFTETYGQPLYLQALLQELLERGILVPRLIEGIGWIFEPQPSILKVTPPASLLPTVVREMILVRLTRLSSLALNLLVAGSVLDHDFTFEELCHVAQLATEDGLTALDEALQSLLLCESSHRREGMVRATYHFSHEKIRELVYATASDARRRVFHSRALTVLEHVDTSVVELERHMLEDQSATLTFH